MCIRDRGKYLRSSFSNIRLPKRIFRSYTTFTKRFELSPIVCPLRLDDIEIVFAPACVNVGVTGVLFFLPFVLGFQRPCRVALVLHKPQNCVLCHSAPFPIPFLSWVFHLSLIHI